MMSRTGKGRLVARPIKSMSKRAEYIPRVTFEEARSLKIARWLLSHPENFYLVDDGDSPMKIARTSTSFNIYCPRKVRLTPAHPGDPQPMRNANVLVGILLVGEKYHGVRPYRWILQVVGPNNIDAMTTLANAIAAEFKVRVLVRLVNDEDLEETLRLRLEAELAEERRKESILVRRMHTEKERHIPDRSEEGEYASPASQKTRWWQRIGGRKD